MNYFFCIYIVYIFVVFILGIGNEIVIVGGVSILIFVEICEVWEEVDVEFEKEKGKKSGKGCGEGKKGKCEVGEDDGFYGNILFGNL